MLQKAASFSVLFTLCIVLSCFHLEMLLKRLSIALSGFSKQFHRTMVLSNLYLHCTIIFPNYYSLNGLLHLKSPPAFERIERESYVMIKHNRDPPLVFICGEPWLYTSTHTCCMFLFSFVMWHAMLSCSG